MKVAKDKTYYATAGVQRYLSNHSEDIHNALDRFKNGDFGSSPEKPRNELIKDFGSYELSFGTLWIISYKLFTNRDFITLLLPSEMDVELQNGQGD